MQNFEKLNITKARYFLDIAGEGVEGIVITIDGQETSVPMDPANRHYKEILRQTQAKTLVIQDANNKE